MFAALFNVENIGKSAAYDVSSRIQPNLVEFLDETAFQPCISNAGVTHFGEIGSGEKTAMAIGPLASTHLLMSFPDRNDAVVVLKNVGSSSFAFRFRPRIGPARLRQIMPAELNQFRSLGYREIPVARMDSTFIIHYRSRLAPWIKESRFAFYTINRNDGTVLWVPRPIDSKPKKLGNGLLLAVGCSDQALVPGGKREETISFWGR
jgi:hypothetical protein